VLIAPIAHLAEIELADANRALERWEHAMGACRRPNFDLWSHGLFEHGELIAVALSSSLICEHVAGFGRDEAFELARLCAARPHINRVMLRLWREMVFPPLCRVRGWSWAVSYQDEKLHSGNTYRHDGWVRLARSRSGTDARSGKRGRNKTIWGWHADAEKRRARAMDAARAA
jgi:hypothetical protein